ncbi:MAG: hypothetical protein RLZZ04_4489 [Cyanobacteriota bacterium]|jgi:hypothetical protein
MGGRNIEEFLIYPAVEENLAASTHNQALNAILFTNTKPHHYREQSDYRENLGHGYAGHNILVVP